MSNNGVQLTEIRVAAERQVVDDSILTVLRVTLDTNCLIDLEQRADSARFLDELVAAHTAQRIRLCVVAISASERAKNGKFAENFSSFEAKLNELGLPTAEILVPLGYSDITFGDHCLFGDGDTLEPNIHDVLFSELPFLWADCCRVNGINVESPSLGTKWRNAKCDVLALWSHIHHSADVFVTSDKNFHKVSKRLRLLALGAKEILNPEQAAAFVRGSIAAIS